MAELAQLEDALVKADAAGNADDARAFASEIRRMRGDGFQSTGGGAAVGNPNLTRGRRAGDVDLAGRVNAATGGLNRGISGLVGLPVDTAENIINLGIAAVNHPNPVNDLTNRLKGSPAPTPPPLLNNSFGGSQFISNLMNRGGINTENPNPEDALSRMLYTGGIVAGGSMVPGAGIRNTALAAGAGAVANEIDPRLVGLATMMPGAARQAVNEFRGSPTLKKNVETFKEADTQPSLGQATENNFLRGLETLASKFPGGQSVMRKFYENQQDNLGKSAQQGKVDAETAGRTIESGITGNGGFVERFKQTQATLYNDLDKYIKADAPVNVTRTKEALAALNSDIEGAPKLSEWFKNAKIQGIEGAIKQDTSGAVPDKMYSNLLTPQKTAPSTDQLPYEAVKKLRTLVGREIADSTIASDVPKSKWKAFYAALSDDLGSAAMQAGPQAQASWTRANNYTRAGMTRIDTVLDKVLGKNRLPEDIFKTVNPSNPDQANRIRVVMRSLQPDERQIVSDAIINRLGKATASNQNEAGDVFSSETFLTNWNKISPQAKSQIMPNLTTRTHLDSIAAVAANKREGSKVFANPSGTAGQTAGFGIAGAAAASLATGNPIPAIAAAGMVTGANLTARLLTNQKFVAWLAQTPKLHERMMPSQLARLGVIYNQERDPAVKADLDKYIESVQ